MDGDLAHHHRERQHDDFLCSHNRQSTVLPRRRRNSAFIGGNQFFESDHDTGGFCLELDGGGRGSVPGAIQHESSAGLEHVYEPGDFRHGRLRLY